METSSSSIAARFGKNLARCRRQSKLSQEELAIRAGVHRTEISQLERGLRVARLDTFVKLKDSLGTNAGGLLDGISWTPGAPPPPGRFQSESPDS